MKIKILELEFSNFKKYRQKKFVFDENETNVFGENRSGKTSILDGFLYLLFGVDSHDRTDFDIKTRDENGATLPKIETNISAKIKVDDRIISLGRTRKEVWSTIRGSNEIYLKSHETTYSWNGIDGMSKTHFEKNRNEIIDKELFKLLTSTTYFVDLDAKVQRKMLISLIDNISDSDVLTLIEKKTEYLVNVINEGSNIESAKKSLQGKIKRIKDELKGIPIRIDQAEKSKPESQDWSQLEESIVGYNKRIKIVEGKIIDKSRILSEFNESRLDEQKKLYVHELELENLKQELSKDKLERRHELEKKKNKITSENISLTSEIERLQSKLLHLEAELKDVVEAKTKLLEDYHTARKDEYKFDDTKGICQSCAREFDDIEKIKIDSRILFDKEKDKKLLEIKINGQSLASDINNIGSSIEEVKKDISSKKSLLDESSIELAECIRQITENEGINPLDSTKWKDSNSEYQNKLKEFEDIKPPAYNVSLLENEKLELNQNIDSVKSLLSTKKTIDNINEQIKELGEKEKSMVQEQLKLEVDLSSLDEFSNIKTKHLQDEVNNKFSFVKFEMFKHHLNGNVDEVCNPTFNGVSFGSLNSEAKTNIGLDIIKTFSEHNNIYAPIFIDNREGVTDIIQMKTQIVNLLVSGKNSLNRTIEL